jgi:predicted PurR-regulated permease PerM
MVVVLFILASLFLSWQIQSSLVDFNENLDTYKKNFSNILDETIKIFPGVDPSNVTDIFSRDIEAADHGYSLLKSVVGTLFNLVGQTIVVLIYLAFLLAEKAGMPERIKQSFDPEQAQRVQRLIDGISEAISSYISVKTFVSFLTGLFTTVVLLLFGVEYAILWGIITFLFNYIPYIGAIVAVLMPSVLALVQYNDLWFAILIWCLLNGVQCIIGYWLEPIMTGSRLNLSPLVVLLALAFWGALWGIVGMILAVPIVVSIKIILEAIPETRPLGGLLGYYDASSKPAAG